jgi:SAM-dependent methyltransferase
MKRSWLSWPIIRHLRAIQFRRLRPLRAGKSHGTHVTRYYWAQFLEQHRADIRGRALEIGATDTIRQYGGAAVTQAEALDLTPHSPEVTVVADLSRADHVPSDVYDCFVNQFTTAVIYDIEAAVYHAVRILKPGGVLLINFWTCDFYFHRGLDMGTGAPMYMYWNFTPIQVENILRAIGLGQDDFSLTVYGNLLSRIAFLLNLPAEEMSQAELDHKDPGQPLLICVRVVKPQPDRLQKPAYRPPPWTPAAEPIRKGARTLQYGDAYG